MANFTYQHKCGHQKEVMVTSTTTAMMEQRFIESTPCSQCFFEPINSTATQVSSALGFAPLTGSIKQVEWAMTIRAAAYESLITSKNIFDGVMLLNSGTDDHAASAESVICWMFFTSHSAKLWIDYRHLSIGAWINLAILHLQKPGVEIDLLREEQPGQSRPIASDLHMLRKMCIQDSPASRLIDEVNHQSELIPSQINIMIESITKARKFLVDQELDPGKKPTRKQINQFFEWFEYASLLIHLPETLKQFESSFQRLASCALGVSKMFATTHPTSMNPYASEWLKRCKCGQIINVKANERFVDFWPHQSFWLSRIPYHCGSCLESILKEMEVVED